MPFLGMIGREDTALFNGRPWHDGLDAHQRRMVYLLVRSVTSIFHMSFADIVAMDRHPRCCEARNALAYALQHDAGLRVAQVSRIIQRRDAQVHEIIRLSKERTVTTPFRNTRIKLTATFAKLNRNEPLEDVGIAWYDDFLQADEEVG